MDPKFNFIFKFICVITVFYYKNVLEWLITKFKATLFFLVSNLNSKNEITENNLPKYKTYAFEARVAGILRSKSYF